MILTVALCIVATCKAKPTLARPQIDNDPTRSTGYISEIKRLETAEKQLIPEERAEREISDHTLYGYSALNRRTRSVGLSVAAMRAVQVGFGVVKELLKDAKKITSSNEFRRKYVKSGGVKQMSKDFNTFLYDDVSKYKTKSGASGRVGKIGDRLIITRSKGVDGKPTLEILRTKDKLEKRLSGRQFDQVRDEITYID